MYRECILPIRLRFPLHHYCTLHAAHITTVPCTLQQTPSRQHPARKHGGTGEGGCVGSWAGSSREGSHTSAETQCTAQPRRTCVRENKNVRYGLRKAEGKDAQEAYRKLLPLLKYAALGENLRRTRMVSIQPQCILAVCDASGEEPLIPNGKHTNGCIMDPLHYYLCKASATTMLPDCTSTLRPLSGVRRDLRRTE